MVNVLSAQEAVNILCDYFLGEDWYTADPVGVEQVNTIAISEILFRYPKKKNLFFRIFSKIKGIYKIHKFSYSKSHIFNIK